MDNEMRMMFNAILEEMDRMEKRMVRKDGGQAGAAAARGKCL